MRNSSLWVTLGLVTSLVVGFTAMFVLAPRSGDELFPGADSVVTKTLEKDGAQPWFKPIFEPGSPEVESGLFALQAALGAGVLGFALGNLRGRSVARREALVHKDL